MFEHDEQMRRQLGLPNVWRLILAFVGGLLLGLLGSLLLGSLDWSGYLFVLIAPLLLGMIGSLTVGPLKKRPKFGGFGIGVISWFGVWLSVLGWESFQPQTISDCFHADPPCYPTTVTFWGGYVWLVLLGFFIAFCVGLVNVLVSWFITCIVLDEARRRANKPDSSQEPHTR